MSYLCEKCKKNCCSKTFKGLFSSAQSKDCHPFVQILLSNEEANRIIDAGFGDLVVRDKISIEGGGGLIVWR